MFSTIQPSQYVALQLPSEAVKVEQIVPNTLINLGKYGSFHANQILGRPFYLTFEILDRAESHQGRELRMVPTAELHADALLEEAETSTYGEDASTPGDVVPNGSVPTPELKSNVNTIDDPSNQKLTMAEIEALKMDETGSSRELINKILQSHSTLEQKTAFSLAKYTLRKHKKYLKRFCVLPLDVAIMTDWQMNERDFGKVLEIRNEMLGLMGSWANVHAAGVDDEEAPQGSPSCRYLVVDDTGGLVVAAMAERMGILHPSSHEATHETTEQNTSPSKSPQQSRHPPPIQPTLSNTLTLIHANSQPNLALLRYFSYDTNAPSSTHPLSTHLHTLSWLQLLDPQSDPTYLEPELVSPQILNTWKSSKRSTYHRKRRRWERTKAIVDSTRLGGFNGLIIASYTSAVSIMHHLVSLLAGGAQVIVYNPHIEPLVELTDLYSTARRTAYLQLDEDHPMRQVPSADFPVDPTLLLTPGVQTGRVRRWQVLPGRTHPLMMGKGGAEGYLFVGTRVVPAEGRIAARGRAKRGRGKKGVYGALGEDVDADMDGDGVHIQTNKEEAATGPESKRVKVGGKAKHADAEEPAVEVKSEVNMDVEAPSDEPLKESATAKEPNVDARTEVPRQETLKENIVAREVESEPKMEASPGPTRDENAGTEETNAEVKVKASADDALNGNAANVSG